MKKHTTVSKITLVLLKQPACIKLKVGMTCLLKTEVTTLKKYMFLNYVILGKEN